MKQDHQITLRLPKECDDFIVNFAALWKVPAAYVYRSAVYEFIRKQKKD